VKIVTLLPFIVLIGAMFLMTRSAKKKQRQAADMRESMHPGTGVRTIGGMYATVKEIRDDTVLLETSPGVQALFAKNAVGAVLDPSEYDRIVSGDAADLKTTGSVVPDDASSLTEATPAAGDDTSADGKLDFTKSDEGADTPAEKETSQDGTEKSETESTKRDGGSDDK
jgi:preprotein translocase subunit YajC